MGARHRILYLLTHTLGLNPIELAFSKLKAHLRCLGGRTLTDVFHIIGAICDLLEPSERWNNFNAVGYGKSKIRNDILRNASGFRLACHHRNGHLVFRSHGFSNVHRYLMRKPQVREQLHRQKLSDQVFERLWDMIVSGELAPGHYLLSERELMERFGVGRPAAREALQMLANKGLITISHGERSRVNELSASIAFDQVNDIAKLLLSAEPSNLTHLIQIRKILEYGTVRLAAKSCTGEDAEDLRKINAKQRADLGKTKAFIQADMAFHVRIAEITGNPLLKEITRSMLTWLFEFYRPLLYWSGHEDTTLAEHDRLVDILETNDDDAAVEMMREHLNRAEPMYTPR